MSNIGKKNGRVEFLRFYFAIMILMFHIYKRFEVATEPIGESTFALFKHGYIGVEFFFLVSGWLLAASCFSKKDLPLDNIGNETVAMIWKKIKNIFPYHFFAMVLTIIVNGYFLYETVRERIFYAIDSWSSIFFVQIFGFKSTWVNKLTWYLDVWLIVTFVFYYLLRRNYDLFVKIVFPVLALFTLGYINHEFGGLGVIGDWTGHFYKCFLRGMAEMALGCSAYSLTRYVNKIHFTKAGKWILAFIEAFGYLLVLRYACSTYPTRYGYAMLFIMMGCLVLTFSNINPGASFWNRPVFYWMGKMSLLIYLNQFYAIRFVQEYFEESTLGMKTLLCVAITLTGSAVCDFVVAKCSKVHPFRKLMIAKEE